MRNLIKRLTTPDKEILATFSIREKELIELTCFTRLSEITENSEMVEFSRLLTWIQRFLGSKQPLSDQDEDALISFLLKFFPEFTLAELKHAVELSAAGELDIADNEHYDRFGSIYISKILKAYRIIRNRSMLEYTKREIARAREQSDQISDEEKYTIIRNGSLERFEEFKEKKHVFDLANVTFNFLYSLKIIPKIEGETKELLEQKATERLTYAAAYTKDKEEKQKLHDLLKAIAGKGQTNKQRLWAEMKVVSLNMFFEQLLFEGKELLMLIESAEALNTPSVLQKKTILKKIA